MLQETAATTTLSEVLERAANGLPSSWIILPRGYRDWTLATPAVVSESDEDLRDLSEDHCCIYSDRMDGVVQTLESWHGETTPASRLAALKYWCEHDAFLPLPAPAAPPST
jgi:hypothetical protein